MSLTTDHHDHVVDTLTLRFPQIDRGSIDAVVTDVEHRYVDARVRTFVPVLVAREARDVLSGRLDVDGRSSPA